MPWGETINWNMSSNWNQRVFYFDEVLHQFTIYVIVKLRGLETFRKILGIMLNPWFLVWLFCFVNNNSTFNYRKKLFFVHPSWFSYLDKKQYVVINKNGFFAIKLLVAPLAFLPFRVLLTCNIFLTYTLSNSHLVIVGRGVWEECHTASWEMRAERSIL